MMDQKVYILALKCVYIKKFIKDNVVNIIRCFMYNYNVVSIVDIFLDN